MVRKPFPVRSGLILCLLMSLILGACGLVPASGALPNPTEPPRATAEVLPKHSLPASEPAVQVPTATERPTVTPVPTTVPPTATPQPDLRPVVGLQVGHWKIEDHPDEQAALRRFSGAYYRGYDEWEVNIVIAELTRDRLEAEGVVVELLPATVPIAYEADVFVSIHVDGVTGAQAATRRGWKVATPFRASLASQRLEAAIATTYPVATGLPADPLGPSYDMRAYYAFAYYRYWHSIAPTTPAVLLEGGFMTHPDDRVLIFQQPERMATGLANGILAYLEAYHPADPDDRASIGPAMLRAIAADTPIFPRADERQTPLLRVGPAQPLVQVAQSREADWYLVFTHGGAWDLGWIRSSAVRDTGEPLEPPHPRP